MTAVQLPNGREVPGSNRRQKLELNQRRTRCRLTKTPTRRQSCEQRINPRRSFRVRVYLEVVGNWTPLRRRDRATSPSRAADSGCKRTLLLRYKLASTGVTVETKLRKHSSFSMSRFNVASRASLSATIGARNGPFTKSQLLQKSAFQYSGVSLNKV